jgi:transposase InsO family protein
MTKTVGQSTILTTILTDKQYQVLKINPKQLSSEAKFRLRFIENYLNHTHNATKTCRLFGIARSLFYKWYGRYNPHNLASLENHSSRPHRIRNVTYDQSVVKLVRSYREDKDTATYSARKLSAIFKRDYEPKFHLSSSTIGRIIAKFKLFCSEVIIAHKKHSKRLKRAWNKLKQRKPYNLIATKPRTLIEFDMKHIYIYGTKYYAFCAIDPLTKESLIHVAKTSSSRQAKLALAKVIATYGRNVSILNDNGSENLGEAWQYLEDQSITQYFARPHRPKDKPYIERLIGTYQRECLDQRRDDITNLVDLDYYTTRFVNNYHYFRPHDSLDNQTPDEFCAMLGLTIRRREVSMR